MTLEDLEYPALFSAADKASLQAQNRYLLATKGTLLLLVIGAVLEAIAGELDSYKTFLAITGAILLFASLAFTVYIRAAKLERTWYGGRAVAESVKSLSWRYMMGADPFPLTQDSAGIDAKFTAQLGSIVNERKELMFGFGGEASDAPQISARMRLSRGAGLVERKDTYLNARIKDQRHWYGAKSKANRWAEERYFVLVIICQLLAATSSLAAVRWPDSKVHLTGLFAALTSSFIAWLEVKQHSELAQAYSVAEFDLSLVEQRSLYIHDEGSFSSFVADAENAISREHTLWIARRDKS